MHGVAVVLEDVVQVAGKTRSVARGSCATIARECSTGTIWSFSPCRISVGTDGRPSATADATSGQVREIASMVCRGTAPR